jgi:predicted PurR-regulated permease PerM
MSNFIKDYFVRLRASDEATKHRSALTISIIASVIVLSIVFLFLKDSVFNFSDSKYQQDATTSANNENNVVSPLISFSQFFKDTTSQFSNIKNDIKEVVSVSSEIKQKNIATTTNTIDTSSTSSLAN